MTTMLTRFPLLLLLMAVSVGGCLPASRSTHSGSRVKQDAQAIHEAHVANNLSAERRQVLLSAEKWLGTPYRYGGSAANGTDCSGFVQRVFQAIQVTLPRTSGEQAETGTPVSSGRIQAGDLLFFNTTGEGVSHVGIAIGDRKFVHASTSSGVIVSSLEEEYYGERFLFARRVL